MTQTSDTLLRLQDVSKRFGKKTALDHISLEIAPGRMVGLLGSNGSGKSTLIKLINGLLVPSSGQIFICGQAPGPETKAIVSYLPERTYLPDTVRVKGLLSFFRDFYTDFDAAKAEEMLQKLDIDLEGNPGKGAADHGHEPPRQGLYSGRADRRRRSRRA